MLGDALRIFRRVFGTCLQIRSLGSRPGMRIMVTQRKTKVVWERDLVAIHQITSHGHLPRRDDLKISSSMMSWRVVT